jgi:hypothetical protein
MRQVTAPLEKLERLRALQTERRRLDEDAARHTDVYAALGFEPLCKPRVQARLDGVPEQDLPPRCGECPQERFLGLPDDNIDALFGGAGGGSKSSAMIIYAIRSCMRYPGLQVFWFRQTFPQVNQSVLRTLARYGYCRSLGAKWDGSKYELRFTNGSILTFAHAKNMQEASSMSSAEINLLIIDERTLMPPAVVDFLYTRVRSGVVGVPCLGVRSASNPGGPGHATVKAGWVDATDHGRREITDDAGRRRLFIPAKASDNPYVGTYEEALSGIADPDLRARIRDGDWSAMPDAAFPDWKHDRIVVPAFEIPESWQRYGGLDYGWTAPSVYLAAAKDGDGRMWFYRELTMRQTPEREQARRVLAVEGQHPVSVRAADPAMWGKTGSALPPASQFAIEGCALAKGDNDRLGGKGRVHTFLAEGPACPHHRSLGWDTCPMLHVLDQACPELVRTMPGLPRDPNRPEDVDTDADDHWYDACRYLLTTIGAAPSVIFDEDTASSDAELSEIGGFGWRPSDLHTPGRRRVGEDDDSPWAQV